MVPILVDPTLEDPFELGEIHNSSYRVHLIPGHEEISDEVVPVKALALATMSVQTVSRTKSNSAHQG